jgi:hypothetical protein
VLLSVVQEKTDLLRKIRIDRYKKIYKLTSRILGHVYVYMGRFPFSVKSLQEGRIRTVRLAMKTQQGACF